MDFAYFFSQIHGWEHLTAFFLGMPRLFSLCLVVPFLGTGILEGQIWLVLVLGLYLPIHPTVLASLGPDFLLSLNLDLSTASFMFLILIKESILGLGLGFLSGLPFWAIENAGGFIDNQRGASQAEGSDILTAKSTTPMGGLFFQCMVFLFYSSGAFLAFLGVIYASYEFWPVHLLIPSTQSIQLPLYFCTKVCWFMTMVLLLSAPVTVACLLVDISLGLINRFSPQLNAYILAMPIKSGLAAFLTCIYLVFLVNSSPTLFKYIHDNLAPLTELIRVR